MWVRPLSNALSHSAAARRHDKVSFNVFRCLNCRSASITSTPGARKKKLKDTVKQMTIKRALPKPLTNGKSQELAKDSTTVVNLIRKPLDKGDSTDLVPYLTEDAHSVHPRLDVTKNLKHLIATNMVDPVNWYPETRKLKRKIIYHCGPTNSGKTYAALQRFMESQTGVYLAPLRLLAIECFTKTNKQNVPCDLLTGERKYYIESEESPANHRACTIELLDFSAKYEVAVIDEIQMIGDLFRGGHWTQSLLGVMAQEVHVCGDGSALKIVESLAKQCGDLFEVKRYKRKSPLIVQGKPLGSLSNVQRGDCIVCFQVKQLFSVGEQLKNLGHNCALIYGALPPGIKINQTEMFNNPHNSCDILVATDAVGMGLNLAIQRIIFYDIEKLSLKENEGKVVDRYSKEKTVLSTSQAKQIAGRAGRYGELYEKAGGQVTALHAEDLKKLREILTRDIPEIQKAGLVLREDVVETFAFYLPGMPFSKILTLFVGMCETDQEYFMCDTSPLVKNALLIDHIDMPLKDKLIFCQVPMRHTVTSRSIAIYVQMARHVCEGNPMTFDWFLRVSGFSRSELINMKHFEDALEIFHLTDIFLWLSYKFHVFQSIESMRTFRRDLDKALRDYIDVNYASINKGTVLQLTSSDNIRELIAEKGTLNGDISLKDANNPRKVPSKGPGVRSSVSRTVHKSKTRKDDLSDDDGNTHVESNAMPMNKRHISTRKPIRQEERYPRSLPSSTTTNNSSADHRLNGFMQFLQKNRLDIKEGSVKWRNLSQTEQWEYINQDRGS